MIQIGCCICILGFTYMWYKMACNDADFVINDIPFTVTKYDKLQIVIYMLLSMYFVSNTSIVTAIFATISLPYLIVSAITDKKTKLVYDMPFYMFGVVAIIMESIIARHISLSVVIIYLFAQTLASMKLFGQGDRAMTVICGTIYFFMYPELTAIDALLINCIMLLIAEILFYIRAIKESNLNGPFKLKESKPLGPDLCLSTFIILLGVTFK